jgi:hypothetical protein
VAAAATLQVVTYPVVEVASRYIGASAGIKGAGRSNALHPAFPQAHHGEFRQIKYRSMEERYFICLI